jgi:hypothetical protein
LASLVVAEEYKELKTLPYGGRAHVSAEDHVVRAAIGAQNLIL